MCYKCVTKLVCYMHTRKFTMYCNSDFHFHVCTFKFTQQGCRHHLHSGGGGLMIIAREVRKKFLICSIPEPWKLTYCPQFDVFFFDMQVQFRNDSVAVTLELLTVENSVINSSLVLNHKHSTSCTLTPDMYCYPCPTIPSTVWELQLLFVDIMHQTPLR